LKEHPNPIKYRVTKEKYSFVEINDLTWLELNPLKKWSAAGRLTKYANAMPVNIKIQVASNRTIMGNFVFFGSAGSQILRFEK